MNTDYKPTYTSSVDIIESLEVCMAVINKTCSNIGRHLIIVRDAWEKLPDQYRIELLARCHGIRIMDADLNHEEDRPNESRSVRRSLKKHPKYEETRWKKDYKKKGYF